MALQVWLPLNKEGDFLNRGLADITVTNTGATYDANGKIGGCYKFGSSKYLKLDNYASTFLTYKEFSLSLWFYCTAVNTLHSGSALISAGNWNLATNLLQLALIRNSSGNYSTLAISGSGVWSAGYSYNFQLNTWYHVVLTSGNNKMRAYINGELIGDSYNAFVPKSLEQKWICIGNGTYVLIFPFNGSINDVRIYDHCLSPKEVKEISKGLVLHYPMNLEGLKLVWWNQLINFTNNNSTQYNVTFTNNQDGSLSIVGDSTGVGTYSIKLANLIESHKYFIVNNGVEVRFQGSTIYSNTITYSISYGILISNTTATNGSLMFITRANMSYNHKCYPQVIDLTAMFGAGKEPTAEQFRKMYPCDYYPYCAGEWRYASGGQYVKFNQTIKELPNINYSVVQSVNGEETTYNGTATSTLTFYNTINNGCKMLQTKIGDRLFGYAQVIRGSYSGTFSLTYGTSANLINNPYIWLDKSNYRYPLARIYQDAVCNDFTIKIMVINLTEMFGAGNEPSTVEEFRALYPNEYYEYVESRYEYTPGYYEGGEVIPHIPDTAFEDFSMYGNKIYDTSGYSNDGDIIGNLITTSDSPRYNQSTSNITEYPLRVKFEYPNFDNITFAFWTKLQSWGSQISGIFSTSSNSETVPLDYSETAFNHRDSAFNIRGTNEVNYRLPLTQQVLPEQEWKHVVVTHNGSEAKCYIDGLLASSISVPTTVVGFKSIFLGWSRAGGLDRKCQGAWSDFRMYATALTPEQIKELYNTSAIITNNHSLFGYEFNESIKNTQVNKNGIINSENFSEIGYKKLSDGSLWAMILYHNKPMSNLFTSSNCTNYNDGLNLYSQIYLLTGDNFKSSEGKYEFMFSLKLEETSNELVYRWTQTKAPVDTVYTDTNSTVGFTNISGASYGLCRKNSSTYLGYSNGNSNWYSSAGCYTAWNGGIPPINGGSAIKSGHLILYVRIDNVPIENMPYIDWNWNVQFHDSFIEANELIEY